jgi:hypothetical protein
VAHNRIAKEEYELNKPNTPSSKRRRKQKANGSADKTIYREDKLSQRLLSRYGSRESVLNLLSVASVADFPNTFVAKAEQREACKVEIDWLSIKQSLANVVIEMIRKAGRESELPDLAKRGTIDRASTTPLLYILEFLPEVFDLALSGLCHEAMMARSVPLGREYVKLSVEILAKMDYDARMRRLEIHEGRRPKWRHRSQYEGALKEAIREVIKDGTKVTQDAVADKLGNGRNEPIDKRVIRNWNTEFGVNWKALVKEERKTDVT